MQTANLYLKIEILILSNRYLSHWYGLREFIILSPKRNNDAITDEDRSNLLLSSTAIAVSNVGW